MKDSQFVALCEAVIKFGFLMLALAVIGGLCIKVFISIALSF